MRRDEIFPSKYLKASDLPEPRVVTIASTAMESFQNDGREQDKLVVSFKERSVKPLIVNMTNFDKITDVAGTDETDRWRGVRIELFTERVPFRGKSVDSVRVREPEQGALPVAGNGRPPSPQGREAARPQPQERPAYDDLNDNVPFD
jgi:hypothetical protein